MPSTPIGLPATFVPTHIDLGHAAWVQHTPFLMDLLKVLRPRTFVELGVHTGNSYFAACETVHRFDLPTQCFAVDTWVGDEHAGFYGEDVFAEVSRTNQAFGFSTLLRSAFRDALNEFEDGSIDLIHFDGRHFYEDIRDDFETWRPKLSDRSIALFHDIHVYERRVGVAPYWEEIAEGFVTFEFNHGHGLGVMLIGDGHDVAFTRWFSDLNAAAEVSRATYFRLGEAVLQHHALARERQSSADFSRVATDSEVERARLMHQLDRTSSELHLAVADNQRRLAQIAIRLSRAASPFFKAWRRWFGRPRAQVERASLTERARVARAFSEAERPMELGRWESALVGWSGLSGMSGERSGLVRAGVEVCSWLVGGGRAVREGIAGFGAGGVAPDGGGAVFSAVTGGVDGSWWPGWLNGAFEYVRFSDRPAASWGVLRIRPLEFVAGDARRSARWVKLHPHLLFPGVRWAVWMDGNVLALDSWRELFDGFVESGMPIGLVRHPLRSTVVEEIEECVRRRKDDAKVLRGELERLGGDPGVGLFETNLVMFDLEHPALPGLLARWWSLLEGGSGRDQVVLPFALRDVGVVPHVLLERTSLRSDRRFVLIPHEGRAWERAQEELSALVDPVVVDPLDGLGRWADQREALLAAQQERTVDVLVPVHDAPVETAQCLESVLATRDPMRHRLVLIDDGSGAETAELLAGVAAREPNVLLLRSEVATGFCRAANRGLRASQAELVILLNSDTVVTGEWIGKLADAVFRPVGVGIAGPMSNAASYQSWPEASPGARERLINQTVINELPPGMSVADVDVMFEGSAPLIPVRVSAVHGFCMAIRREVLSTVGFFDEEGFADGFGEEVDYCLRAVDAGWSLVWATNTYVYHHKSASYGEARRAILARQGRNIIIQKHGELRRRQAIDGCGERAKDLQRIDANNV